MPPRNRNHAAEQQRRNELARARGYANRYEERKAKARTTGDWVKRARQWDAYRKNYPTVAVSTIASAKLFLNSFGSQGKSGIPNEHGGFKQTADQAMDWDVYIATVQNDALHKWGLVHEMGDEWWSVWREEYADRFL